MAIKKKILKVSIILFTICWMVSGIAILNGMDLIKIDEDALREKLKEKRESVHHNPQLDYIIKDIEAELRMLKRTEPIYKNSFIFLPIVIIGLIVLLSSKKIKEDT